MRRYFYIADDLGDITNLENTLREQGFSDSQYHTLSNDDAELSRRNLHDVASIMKQDLIHSAELGAAIGVFSALTIIILAHTLGWSSGSIGWTPFVMIAVLAFCFCTWEGAFLGMQTPNAKFKRFEKVIEDGKHVFFVDVDKTQETMLQNIMTWQPTLEPAGTGSATPGWILKSQDSFQRFVKAMP